MNEEMATNRLMNAHTFKAVCFASHDNCRVASKHTTESKRDP